LNLFAQGYRNPIVPGFHPDPSVCRVDSDYYLVTSSFEYFPGIPVFHSKDLIHWKQIGHCLTRDSQLNLGKCEASSGLWAPTIHYHKGLFYMVNTNMAHGGNYYVTTTDPAGEWSEPIWVKQGGIDPALFWDEDGSAYFMSNGFDGEDSSGGGIAISKIDLATGKLLSEPKFAWIGTGGRFPEAPHIYKRDGWYYLLISEGGTEYAHYVSIARSQNIFGPYEGCPFNPILTHNNRLAQRSPIQGTGHADLVQAHDGSWWVVFLGFRPLQRQLHNLGRETFLAPVSWPKNGWPAINGDAPISLEMNVPTLPQHPFNAPKIRDDFDSEKLGFEWNYLRNPQRKNYSLSDKKGFLTLTASPISIDAEDSPTFLGRRQQHIQFTATTQMEFAPARSNEIAGITVYMNNTHHYDLYLKKGNILVLRYKLEDIEHIEKEVKIKSGNVQLCVEGNNTQYTFSYREDGGKMFQILGTPNTAFISTETAGGFTGVYIGLFASGNGQATQSKARFDWFDYAGKE
jgi:alpha-N-arabinofuranosidase